MEFLHKLYDMENFGIILFAIIVVLILLFLLILFFGKKDEKKEEKVQEINTDNNAFKEENTKEDLSIPEVAQPVVEGNNLDNIFADKEEAPVAEENNLSDKIREDMANAVKANESLVADIPAVEEQQQVPIVEDVFEEEAPVEDIFADKEEAPVAEEPKKEEIELPKMVEMPKLKKDEEEAPVAEVPMIEEETPAVEEEKEEVKKEETVSDFDKLFGEIKSETYSIDK